MKHKPILTFILLFPFLLFFANSCKKNKSPECVVPMIVPYQPYSYPVWHPDGNLLGFNHTPQTGVFQYGAPPCEWYMNAVNRDSAGFYMMNKDGSSFRRVTNYYLYVPAWSPDGNWLAFMHNAQIYKMYFDGHDFDTAHIIQLTDTAANSYPSWTTNSDTIYYDSNLGTPKGTNYYAIWKISSDGKGKLRVSAPGSYGRQPVVASGNLIYYSYYLGTQPEIFSMNNDGSEIRQITFNGKKGLRKTPKYSNGQLFFWDVSIISTAVNQFLPFEVCKATLSFYDISTNGEILFVTNEFGIKDNRFGTIWICNNDGSHKRQLTFNNY